MTMFADLVYKQVLFDTHGKDASVGDSFAEALQAPNGHPNAVTQVASDMISAFTEGVREDSGIAARVFDRFHVIQKPNKGVEVVRCLEAQQDEWKARRLAESQWFFGRTPKTNAEREAEHLDQIDWKYLMTVRAYQMRLILQEIYQVPDVEQACKDFESCCGWVKEKAQQKGHQVLEPMGRVAPMLERHLKDLLGHCEGGADHRLLGRTEQPVCPNQTQSQGLLHHREFSSHAPSCRRQATCAMRLIH